MIKFVLHGGNTSEVNKDNNSFFREMTVNQKKSLKVLLCYFACEEEDIDKKFKQDIGKFKKYSIKKKLEFDVAEVKTFGEQIKKSDAIYLRGGNTSWLVNKLMRTKDLEKLLEGKVVGGSSAGVYCLAKYYFGNDSKKLGKGIGVLNIKAFCHYRNNDTIIIEKLTSYKEKLPLLILPNYKWVVMYK